MDDLRTRLQTHTLACPDDPPGTLIPTSVRLLSRLRTRGREALALRRVLARLAMTPEQRIGVANGLAALDAAIAQTAAAAGLARTGRR